MRKIIWFSIHVKFIFTLHLFFGFNNLIKFLYMFRKEDLSHDSQVNVSWFKKFIYQYWKTKQYWGRTSLLYMNYEREVEHFHAGLNEITRFRRTSETNNDDPKLSGNEQQRWRSDSVWTGWKGATAQGQKLNARFMRIPSLTSRTSFLAQILLMLS